MDHVDALRTSVLADLIARGALTSAKLRALGAEWGATADEVRAYRREAIALLASDRGSLREQREVSISYSRARRDRARREGDRQMATARKAMGVAEGAEDPKVRLDALREETFARKHAETASANELRWHVHADKVSGVAPPTSGRAGVLQDPDIAAVMQVQEAVLAALVPGAIEALDEGTAVWTRGGEPALRAWLAERQASR